MGSTLSSIATFDSGWKRPRPPSLRSEPLKSQSRCVQLTPTRYATIPSLIAQTILSPAARAMITRPSARQSKGASQSDLLECEFWPLAFAVRRCVGRLRPSNGHSVAFLISLGQFNHAARANECKIDLANHTGYGAQHPYHRMSLP